MEQNNPNQGENSRLSEAAKNKLVALQQAIEGIQSGRALNFDPKLHLDDLKRKRSRA